ncbi:STAS/SEC14 domain-containing protein [Hyphomonas sp.]
MWKEVTIGGDGVLGLECDGKLSKQDFETMHAWLDRELAAAAAKPALVIFMGSFEGYKSAAAMWADMKVDTRHADDFSRVAMIADQAWIEWGTKAANLVAGANLKWFDPTERKAAIAWAQGAA